MTPREKRLLRLTELRERLHDVAALQLRAASSRLAGAEAALVDANERTRAAQLCRLAAAAGDDASDWLPACAEIELSMLTTHRVRDERATARSALAQAADNEAAARRDRKQMEATLARVRQNLAQHAQRAEQATLDEITRLQRAATAGRHASRRDL